MGYAAEAKKAKVIFSLASGHNFYFYHREKRPVFFDKQAEILEHLKPTPFRDGKSREIFYLKKLSKDSGRVMDLKYWLDLIRKPVDAEYYIWPVDIVALSDDPDKSEYALVFPFSAWPDFVHITPFLSNLDIDANPQNLWPDSEFYLGRQNPFVRSLITSLLGAWRAYDRSNYAYHEFSYANIYYRKNDFRVKFDFSFSAHKVLPTDQTIVPMGHIKPKNNKSVLLPNPYSLIPCGEAAIVDESRITADYADPYYYHSQKGGMDLYSDYFAMAAILFKLLIGKLPYAGSILEGEPNIKESEHALWLKIYHKNPVFIFDLEDRSNRLGSGEPEIYQDRWNQLDQSLRNMFHNTFQRVNVLRETADLKFYSPDQWQKALAGQDGVLSVEC